MNETNCDLTAVRAMIESRSTGKPQTISYPLTYPGEDYIHEMRMTIIPLEKSLNDYFIVGLTSDYDEIITPMHKATLGMIAYSAMAEDTAVKTGLSFVTSVSSSKDGQAQAYTHVAAITLNGTTTIVGYADSEDDFRALSQQIYDELEIYHQLYDIYNTYEGMNNLKTINDMAGISPVQVDEKIMALMVFCRDMYDQTNGLVDAAMGSVLSLWHEARTYGIDYPEEAYLPDPQALATAALHTGFDQVILDQENSTVFLPDPMMQLDVGALGKGFAVEQVCRKGCCSP